MWLQPNKNKTKQTFITHEVQPRHQRVSQLIILLMILRHFWQWRDTKTLWEFSINSTHTHNRTELKRQKKESWICVNIFFYYSLYLQRFFYRIDENADGIWEQITIYIQMELVLRIEWSEMAFLFIYFSILVFCFDLFQNVCFSCVCVCSFKAKLFDSAIIHMRKSASSLVQNLN